MKEEELNDLKYRDLQKVAKDNGVKANMPKAALITALLEVFQKDEKATIPSNPNPIHEIPQEEQNPIVESIKSIVTPSKPIEIATAKKENVAKNVPTMLSPEIKKMKINDKVSQKEAMKNVIESPLDSEPKLESEIQNKIIELEGVLDSNGDSCKTDSEPSLESETQSEIIVEKKPKLSKSSVNEPRRASGVNSLQNWIRTRTSDHPSVNGSNDLDDSLLDDIYLMKNQTNILASNGFNGLDNSKDLGDVVNILKNQATKNTYFNYSVYYKASCYGVSPYKMYYARYCSDYSKKMGRPLDILYE